jgi:hypothetical protein
VDNSICWWKDGRHGMVIGNDGLQAKRLRQCNFFGITDAAVTGDDERSTVVFEQLYSSVIESIAVCFAVG